MSLDKDIDIDWNETLENNTAYYKKQLKNAEEELKIHLNTSREDYKANMLEQYRKSIDETEQSLDYYTELYKKI